MTKTMYRREIMELYSEKPNYGTIENPTHAITFKNPTCDDEIVLELRTSKEGKILDAKFHGKTCFISTIAASTLLEMIKGMNLNKVKNITKEDIDKELGINITPTRLNCELMPLHALKQIKC